MKISTNIDRWGSHGWGLWGTMEMELTSYPVWPSVMQLFLTRFLDKGVSPDGFYRIGGDLNWVFYRGSGEMELLSHEAALSQFPS